MNGLNNVDKTDREYTLTPTDDLVRFWRSKVIIMTPWFKYVMSKAFASTLGHQSPFFSVCFL